MRVCRIPQHGQPTTTEVCGGARGRKTKVSHFLSICSILATRNARDLHHQSSHRPLRRKPSTSLQPDKDTSSPLKIS